MSAFPTVSVPLGPGLLSPLPLSTPQGQVPQTSWASAAATAPRPPFAGTREAPGAYPQTRHLPRPQPPPQVPRGKPPGPARPAAGHLLSAATVPASSNRQSWRVRASSRALGAGSCFQSSRSPLLRAMGAAGRSEERAGAAGEGGMRPPARVANEPPPPQAHGARRSGGRQQPRAPRGSSSERRVPDPGSPLLPGGEDAQGGGRGRRPCPLSGSRSPQRASQCLRGSAQR